MNKLEDIVCWEVQTNKITEDFLYDYFDDNDPDYSWVVDEIGGVFIYGDYFFDFNTVLTCYKLGITEEQLLNWYYFCIESHSINISLAKFILSPEDRKKAEEKHLAELKDKVKSAEKEFKEALEKYEKN